MLWREAFYRPIQELRRRLRRSFEAGDAGQPALRKVPPSRPPLPPDGMPRGRGVAPNHCWERL